jgi:hypothetical protein
MRGPFGRLPQRALMLAPALRHLHWASELTLLAAIALALAPAIAAASMVDRRARAEPAPPVATAAPEKVPVGPAGLDDMLPIATIPTPEPPPRRLAWAQLPVNLPATVFIPTTGVYNPTTATPNAGAGHSDTWTPTFDDCADPAAMGAIADSLARTHRQALFFITGQCRDRYPWLVGQLQQAGQLVCNHTYSHPDLRRLTDAQVRYEIGNGVLAGCPYFRPPYGAWDGPRGRIARIAAEFGLTVMLWDVDTRDWAGAEAAPMADAVRRRGGIVLFHLHGRHTLEALDLLLPA